MIDHLRNCEEQTETLSISLILSVILAAVLFHGHTPIISILSDDLDSIMDGLESCMLCLYDLQTVLALGEVFRMNRQRPTSVPRIPNFSNAFGVCVYHMSQKQMPNCSSATLMESNGILTSFVNYNSLLYSAIVTLLPFMFSHITRN